MCKLVLSFIAALAAAGLLSGCNGAAVATATGAHTVRSMDNFGGILSHRSMDNFGGILHHKRMDNFGGIL